MGAQTGAKAAKTTEADEYDYAAILIGSLEVERDIRRKAHPELPTIRGKQLRWHGEPDLVLSRGRAVTLQGPPDGVRMGVPRHCYSNCHRVVMKTDRFLYCEGYVVVNSLPWAIQHAWLYDWERDTHHDITLRDLPRAAFGLCFHPTYSRMEYSREVIGWAECVALLDAWNRGWPLLSMTDEELAAVTVTLPAPVSGGGS